MAKEEHEAILEQGVEVWNAWRRNSRDKPDLSHTDFRGRDLRKAHLGNAELGDANFNEANLTGANFSNSDLFCAELIDADLHSACFDHSRLIGVNFSGANLSEVSFYEANLCEANLSSANLAGANLNGADCRSAVLKNTDLTGANINFANLGDANCNGANFTSVYAFKAIFGSCDLSHAKGLDSMILSGPSSIDIDTIYLSKGKIPHSFLRGCGVPEGFITQMHSLVGAEEDIQFYSCFISYSFKDEEFARRLHARMREARLRVWFAPEEMKGGNLLIEQIETAIRVYDKVLIVLSKASLQSEWVMTELRKARKAERQTGKRKLFPVRLVDMEKLKAWECFDADSGKDLAVELREYFIPDFSNWKDHDQFETAFSRLLKDLRAEKLAK